MRSVNRNRFVESFRKRDQFLCGKAVTQSSRTTAVRVSLDESLSKAKGLRGIVLSKRQIDPDVQKGEVAMNLAGGRIRDGRWLIQTLEANPTNSFMLKRIREE
ncbi:MAG TPA: hypothetical protein DDW52_24745 [Planctomycetaceae bacterium]|nr:hypothetical protein [Planctomycetaceae bacterium]